MADGVVQVAPDSTGKIVDCTELTVGIATVERQRVVIAGAAATDLAVVANGAVKVFTDQTTHGTTDLVAADHTKIAGTAIDVNSGQNNALGAR
jgi:fructose-1,6-bisphosphatase/inositol monophosphatase family enzyme